MLQYIPHARFYVVKSQEMAAELMKRKFVLEKLEPNKDGSGRNVFLFSNSQLLIDNINEILASR